MPTRTPEPGKRKVFHPDTLRTKAIREVASEELTTEGILRQLEHRERQSRYNRNLLRLIAVAAILLASFLFFI